jgi:hypothetical protein
MESTQRGAAVVTEACGRSRTRSLIWGHQMLGRHAGPTAICGFHQSQGTAIGGRLVKEEIVPP